MQLRATEGPPLWSGKGPSRTWEVRGPRSTESPLAQLLAHHRGDDAA